MDALFGSGARFLRKIYNDDIGHVRILGDGEEETTDSWVES